MILDDYECKSCHCLLEIPEGMDELDESLRFCGPCAITEIERLRRGEWLFPVFDAIDRLLKAGYWFDAYDGKVWLKGPRARIVASGDTFRELCVNIVFMGL